MQDIDVNGKQIDSLLLVKHFIDELGLYDLFKEHIPCAPQAKVEPAEILCMLISNLIISPKPLYQVDRWAKSYVDGFFVDDMENANLFNDDRLGWSLDNTYESDRNTIMTRLTGKAIELHQLQTNSLHNDTTTVTVQGAYDNEPKEGVINLKHGHNKDYRPDCKQLVFGLTTTDDGHVPIHFKIFDGNTADVTTHMPIWSELKKMLKKEDFIYIADSKLCSFEILKTINDQGGKFITIVPKNRKEVKEFYTKLRAEDIVWEEAYGKPHSRKKDVIIKFKTYEAESRDGYRIIWVHSSAKAVIDKSIRDRKIKKIGEKLTELTGKLNKYNLKTKDSIEPAIKKIVGENGDLFDVTINEEKSIEKVKKGRGRAGPNSQYVDIENIEYSLSWELKFKNIELIAKTDGVFPLITNTDLLGKEVLKQYKDQAYLEKRHSNLKSVLEVAPVYLKNETRIEAMMFLYFIALMIISLIERRLKNAMKEESIKQLHILPENRKTESPTWNNIRYFMESVRQSIIIVGGKFHKATTTGLTKTHELLLRLLDIPLSKYKKLSEHWWRFSFNDT